MLLLDTCAALWITEDVGLSDVAVEAVDGAQDRGDPVYLSPITAWEIGSLVARGRLALSTRPHRWFDRLLAAPHLHVAELSASVLIDAWFLPGDPPRDPADRILIATARERDLTLMTRDRQILDYADAGHVQAMAC